MGKAVRGAAVLERLRSSGAGNVTLLGCFLLAAALCYAQIRGSTVLIAACLGAFLIFFVRACGKGKLFSVLLFFLPWSPLMKLYRGGISFFTVALLLGGVICLWKNKLRIHVYESVLAAFIMAVTLVAKVVHANDLAANYLCFLAMLVLFPCVVKGSGEELDFWELTVFFACGIVAAALSAQQVAGYPNISRYIRINAYSQITRLSGYYGDPNFYSAHVTACLAGVQVLLTREKERWRQAVLAVLSLFLVYCGLISASKSFVLVTACLFLVWVPLLLEKGNRGGRLRVFLGIVCAGAIILSSPLFQNLLQVMDHRFSNTSSLSEFTTKRTELWSRYLKEFLGSAPLTLLGEGYSGVNLNGRASHNTLIQGIYQFGVIGFSMVCGWLWLTLRGIFRKVRAVKLSWKYAALMCVGVALPWMALDILFFDEFFLLPVYAVVGTVYGSRGETAAGEGTQLLQDAENS